MTQEVAHPWVPITDLRPADLAAASDELPALASVWAEQRTLLGPDRALDEFNERLRREWAIETGVIERIYTLDRGTTQILIEHGIDAAFIAHGDTDQPPELVAAIIKDQYAAVEWLFDFVAARRELTTSFVREIHALMTRNQSTWTAVDQFGVAREVDLLHGEYKRWPNNPRRPDGTMHEYCPPVHVAAEMDRLVELHRVTSPTGSQPRSRQPGSITGSPRFIRSRTATGASPGPWRRSSSFGRTGSPSSSPGMTAPGTSTRWRRPMPETWLP